MEGGRVAVCASRTSSAVRWLISAEKQPGCPLPDTPECQELSWFRTLAVLGINGDRCCTLSAIAGAHIDTLQHLSLIKLLLSVCCLSLFPSVRRTYYLHRYVVLSTAIPL